MNFVSYQDGSIFKEIYSYFLTFLNQFLIHFFFINIFTFQKFKSNSNLQKNYQVVEDICILNSVLDLFLNNFHNSSIKKNFLTILLKF